MPILKRVNVSVVDLRTGRFVTKNRCGHCGGIFHVIIRNSCYNKGGPGSTCDFDL